MSRYLLIALFLFSFYVNGQTSKNVEPSLFKINFLAPGVSYELGTGLNSSFNFDFLVGIEVEGSSRSGTIIELFPALGAEYRYYHNMNKRLAKNRNISGNSGNYIGVVNRIIVRAPILGNIEYDSPISYNGAIVYGLQRTYTKGFYFTVQAGPGLFVGDETSVGLFLDGKIGWVLGKRK